MLVAGGQGEEARPDGEGRGEEEKDFTEKEEDDNSICLLCLSCMHNCAIRFEANTIDDHYLQYEIIDVSLLIYKC